MKINLNTSARPARAGRRIMVRPKMNNGKAKVVYRAAESCDCSDGFPTNGVYQITAAVIMNSPIRYSKYLGAALFTIISISLLENEFLN